MSNASEKDVAFIRALAELLKDSDLAEIEVKREYAEGDELKVRLSRAAAIPATGIAPQVPALAPPVPLPHHVAPSAQQNSPSVAMDEPDLSKAVTSPMVGTVYLAPEPGADPFVSPGDQVSEGQTILIIEAMKTMNHIPAPRGGRVRTILVDNAEPVEFGEPPIIIE